VYLRLRFNLHGRNLHIFKELKPPYLILANHVGYWDPFMVSSVLPDPVHWVAADQTFRSVLQGYLLQFVGAIPKTKGVSDFETIRSVLRIREAGGVIGLFPEGQRTWDGVTLPLLPATAKLVKLLRVPVVVAKFKGAYFGHPRWARRPRCGKIVVAFHRAMEPADLRSLSPTAIHQRLQSLLEHDDYQYQSRRMRPYRDPRRAEYIENVLIYCPECLADGSIHSRGHRFHCRSCGTRWIYTREGFITVPRDRTSPAAAPTPPRRGSHPAPAPTPPTFSTIRDWNRWQRAELQRRITAATQGGGSAPGGGGASPGAGAPGGANSAPAAGPGAGPGTAIFHEGGIVLSTGFRSARIRRLAVGSLSLYPDRLVFREPTGDERHFLLAGISGINIQLVRKVELYYQDALFTFDPLSPRVNMYKLYAALEMLTLAQGAPGRA
jgi:1-acyl-sn-glycerol-3-phosphate acyltransferase